MYFYTFVSQAARVVPTLFVRWGNFRQRLRLRLSKPADHFLVPCWKIKMAIMWILGENSHAPYPLLTWLRCNAISRLELEKHMQHLRECSHFPSFLKRVKRRILEVGRSDFTDGVDCVSSDCSRNLDTSLHSHVLICEFNPTQPNRDSFKAGLVVWRLEVCAEYFRKFRAKWEFVSSPQGIQHPLFQQRNYRF